MKPPKPSPNPSRGIALYLMASCGSQPLGDQTQVCREMVAAVEARRAECELPMGDDADAKCDTAIAISPNVDACVLALQRTSCATLRTKLPPDCTMKSLAH